MIGGSLVLRASMLFALTFFVQFLIGGLTGIFVASPVLDYHVNDSYFVIATSTTRCSPAACSGSSPASTTGSRR